MLKSQWLTVNMLFVDFSSQMKSEPTEIHRIINDFSE